MATRKELMVAVSARYREASAGNRRMILDEFVATTGYHRKHAIRVLRSGDAARRPRTVRDRVYDEAVGQALVVLWEAGDRVCSKRLKALLPVLIAAMHRHGHLDLNADVKAKLLAVSPATMDRILRATRTHIGSQRQRRGGVGAAIRRHIPVRTFADWCDPPPGFFEIDMVEHCGGTKIDGNFVHSLVLTDIASGWAECVAMPLRNQSLIIEAMSFAASNIPFAMLGADTDNDSAFINQTVFDYCKKRGLEQTRSRPYRKNDQAWIEQKNGAIVRRLVGYGLLSGLVATQTLADLYSASRLYVNYFQPSFKLESKTRDGARVRKRYHPPATPHERLMASPHVNAAVKVRLKEEFARLDPVLLLRDIRSAQQALSDVSTRNSQHTSTRSGPADITAFLGSLATAWKNGEVRPTHRRKPTAPRSWRTRTDPFEPVWRTIENWLDTEPTVSAKELMDRLAGRMPELYASKVQLRTLQRRILTWRSERAKELVFGRV